MRLQVVPVNETTLTGIHVSVAVCMEGWFTEVSGQGRVRHKPTALFEFLCLYGNVFKLRVSPLGALLSVVFFSVDRSPLVKRVRRRSPRLSLWGYLQKRHFAEPGLLNETATDVCSLLFFKSSPLQGRLHFLSEEVLLAADILLLLCACGGPTSNFILESLYLLGGKELLVAGLEFVFRLFFL